MDKKEKTLMWSLLLLYTMSGKMANEKVRRSQMDQSKAETETAYSSPSSRDEHQESQDDEDK